MSTMALQRPVSVQWDVEQAAALYGIRNWSNGYFDISPSGEVVVNFREGNPDPGGVSLIEILRGLRERGTQLPVLLRFRDFLTSRIAELNESFAQAIRESSYNGVYRGVYPIKVNQQQQVLEEITRFGERYHYGLEAGSKPELIAALAYLRDREAYIICNGYKDEEFIDLALQSSRMGLQVILVLEMPGELPLILERARLLGIDPALGIRVRLSTRGSGHWAESAGDRSVFGLNMSQVIDAVDYLKDQGSLHCLRLLHYHQGSQIPNIRAIREACVEATRIYVNLVQEGAPMGLLDLGGGLAVDYDGSQSSSPSSSNYGIQEYCVDLIEAIKQVADEAEVAHPDIITESGRAVVAYYSVLLFNILDVSSFEPPASPAALPEGAHETLAALYSVEEALSQRTAREGLNDAVYYRDQLRSLFVHGSISLRERGLGEKMFWHLVTRIARLVEDMDPVPEELEDLQGTLVDFYYGNFSLFQSLPDSWAISQLFPVMPIHRLGERPVRRAVLADITCDCDGKMDRFINLRDSRQGLPVHPLRDDEEYFLGVFLVGAYQETLGDLHNLLGDTNVVSISLEDGRIRYTHEIKGDSVADVLTYVEYDPKELTARFRHFAEAAVAEGRITPQERRRILTAYEDGLRGYTYYEHP